MVKKKIDNRIRVMIENGVKLNHRSMFIIIGDKARDQVNTQYKQSSMARHSNELQSRIGIPMKYTFMTLDCSTGPYSV